MERCHASTEQVENIGQIVLLPLPYRVAGGKRCLFGLVSARDVSQHNKTSRRNNTSRP